MSINPEAPFTKEDFYTGRIGLEPESNAILPDQIADIANVKFKQILEAGKKMYSSSEGNSVWTTYSVPSYKFEGVLLNIHEKT